MSQDYKLKYAQMRENAAANSSEGAEPSAEQASGDSYPTASNTRNLCLCWPDGRKMFLNYAYLVSGEYQPEANMISLIFTTHLVVIKGHALDGLFEELSQHIPKQIAVVDGRYLDIIKSESSCVTEIFCEST